MTKKITILLLALCVIFMTACSPATPTDILKADLEKVKASPDNVIKWLNSEYAFGKEATEALVKKITDFDYEFGEEKFGGGIATVEVTITTYPFGDILSQAITESLSAGISSSGAIAENDMISLMTENLVSHLDKAKKTYTAIIMITLSSKNGKWVANENDDFINAISGGLFDIVAGFSALG